MRAEGNRQASKLGRGGGILSAPFTFETSMFYNLCISYIIALGTSLKCSGTTHL